MDICLLIQMVLFRSLYSIPSFRNSLPPVHQKHFFPGPAMGRPFVVPYAAARVRVAYSLASRACAWLFEYRGHDELFFFPDRSQVG